MAGKITFKVETAGSVFGVRIFGEDATRGTPLKFDKKTNTAVANLDKGAYVAYWAFFGNPSATFKLTISDAVGTNIKTAQDKIPVGQAFEHDMTDFNVS